mmetsp:Transcript_26920/g.82866  ORF Transcript_26920/g.82866 Transcript_26920/m.82866 type:complete len:379 (-) Transcript_26920:136-1272(-)
MATSSSRCCRRASSRSVSSSSRTRTPRRPRCPSTRRFSEKCPSSWRRGTTTILDSTTRTRPSRSRTRRARSFWRLLAARGDGRVSTPRHRRDAAATLRAGDQHDAGRRRRRLQLENRRRRRRKRPHYRARHALLSDSLQQRRRGRLPRSGPMGLVRRRAPDAGRRDRRRVVASAARGSRRRGRELGSLPRRATAFLGRARPDRDAARRDFGRRTHGGDLCGTLRRQDARRRHIVGHDALVGAPAYSLGSPAARRTAHDGRHAPGPGAAAARVPGARRGDGRAAQLFRPELWGIGVRLRNADAHRARLRRGRPGAGTELPPRRPRRRGRVYILERAAPRMAPRGREGAVARLGPRDAVFCARFRRGGAVARVYEFLTKL